MSNRPTNILLADDDPEDQEILQEAILQQDPTAAIHTVQDGQEVLKYLLNCNDHELPSLIILDYKMPLLSAIEVLHKIGADARYAAIPKIVWSTSSQQEHIKACIDQGAVQYFVKPNNIPALNLIATKMLATLAQ